MLVETTDTFATSEGDGAPARMSWKKARVALNAHADIIKARVDAHIAHLEAVDPERAKHFISRLTPELKAKHLDAARFQIGKWGKFLPHLTGVTRSYEIGVGPGYLLKLMILVHGTKATGCDLDPSHAKVFELLWKELGVADLVEIHRVRRRRPIPVPDGADAVLAFSTTFNEGYTLADHQWFVDHLRERLVGEKQVFMLFNTRCFEHEGVREFYSGIADFPLLDPSRAAQVQHWDSQAFCRLRLA